MAFCLNKNLTKKFLEKLKSREIDPEELAEMTSKQRHDFFTGVFNDDSVAKEVNALFESKLLLKRQQEGMINWAKKVSGIKPDAQKDMISRIRRMEKVLDPAEEEAFLQDLASKKLGVEVSYEEAQKITELSDIIEERKTRMLEGGEKERLAYGEAVIKMLDYMRELNPPSTKVVTNVATLPKTVMASLDFSAPFRQGWGMMSRSEFWKAFPKMFQYGFSENAFKELQADLISRPTYRLMKKSGLRISAITDKLNQREEQFMSRFADKIPVIRGSERAYVGFLNKVRADVFDHLVRTAEMAGEDVSESSQVIKDLANVVNDFTGSGNIGTGDKYANVVPVANAALFSPRKISATVNMLNPQRYVDPRISATARKAALRQMIGSLALSATVLGMGAFLGADLEVDPRSPDFGKVKIGKTRYDVTGGNGTYAVLLARLLTNKTKSSTTGKVRELGVGYKADSRDDIAVKFLRNKSSPLASLLWDYLAGEDALGRPFKWTDELRSRALPLIVSDAINMQQNDPDQLVPAIIANLFGFGISSY